MIAIIDYGVGNIGSILNMIRRVGGDAVIVSSPHQLQSASALVLPGVGAFDNAVSRLNTLGFDDVIKKLTQEDCIPLLGICLGMQLLFSSSEEGRLPGLGLLPGIVQRFRGNAFDTGQLKIPHMGWNIVTPTKNRALFSNLDENARFYFVHSYHVVCEDRSHVVATSEYGYEFTCAVHYRNIYGVQFHPEKSHKFGMTLFRNFLQELC